jgi:hypothetical protein
LLPVLTAVAGVSSVAIAETDSVKEDAIAQRRIRATFFEEEQNSGFTNSFLGDALGGISDPLGDNATTAGDVTTTSDSLQTSENSTEGGLSTTRSLPSVTPSNGETPAPRPTGIGIFRSLPPSLR